MRHFLFAMMAWSFGLSISVTGVTSHAVASEDSCALFGSSGVENGLCNAYCEIMDCDSDDPMASEGACLKLEDKFFAKTGSIPPCAAIADGAVIEEVETEPGYRGALVSWPDGTFQGFLDGHNQSGEFGARTACEAKLHVCFSQGGQEVFAIEPQTVNECFDACSNFQALNDMTCTFEACLSRCNAAFLSAPLPCE